MNLQMTRKVHVENFFFGFICFVCLLAALVLGGKIREDESNEALNQAGISLEVIKRN